MGLTRQGRVGVVSGPALFISQPLTANMPASPHRLLVYRPSGGQYEHPDHGRYMAALGHHLARIPKDELERVHFFQLSQSRIGMGRNEAIHFGIQQGCTRVLMIDPDMSVDRYVGTIDGAVPFFESAWQFLNHNKVCICAAPYCGSAPNYDVQVFTKRETDDGTKTDEVVRLPRDQAATLTGWKRVIGVGTGLMLIDMNVFRVLQPPFFDDQFDEHQTSLIRSQDINFCMKCHELGIRIYVNFDAWAGHWQMQCVERPGYDGPPIINLDSQNDATNTTRPDGPAVQGTPAEDGVSGETEDCCRAPKARPAYTADPGH